MQNLKKKQLERNQPNIYSASDKIKNNFSAPLKNAERQGY